MYKSIKLKIRSFVYSNSLMKKIYLKARLIQLNLTKNISDEKYAKLHYKRRTGKELNLNDPVTYNEKLWWLKLNNRDPLLTTCSDKYKVKGYLEKLGLGNIVPELYGVYNKPEDIDFNEIPDKAFIKINNGSGTNQVWDSSKPFDKKIFIKRFNNTLKTNYYYYSREWNYKNIKPKIIIEEMLETNDDRGLVDYKFMCFDGRVKMVFVELDIINSDGTQNSSSQRNVYDREFNYLDVQFGRLNMDKSLTSKPINFEKMLEYAEIISKPFPHCRVDLYNINGKILFGETTFYHAGGTAEIKPKKYNKIAGDWIDINSEKIILVN